MGRGLTLPSIDDGGDICGVHCSRGISLRLSSRAMWVKGQHALRLHTHKYNYYSTCMYCNIASKQSVIIAGQIKYNSTLKMSNVQGIRHTIAKIFHN